MKKRFLFYLLLLPAMLYAQAEYVTYTHPVYEYLERLDALHIVDGFNKISKPQTRREIASLIVQAAADSIKLDEADQLRLRDYLKEFEFEIYGTLNNSEALIDSCLRPSAGRIQHLYFTADTLQKASLFIDLFTSGQSVFINVNSPENVNTSASFVKYGGVIRGTFRQFAFMMKANNGRVWGNNKLAVTLNDLKYQFKFNSDPDISSNKYFDDTEGYLSADFDFIKFKIGRDQNTIGPGAQQVILSDNSPKFDYIQMQIDYSVFSFSYMHGKMLGYKTAESAGNINLVKDIVDKYFVYHRLGLKFCRDFSFGAGEMVIYGNRSYELSYLNPFNFYKSIEHFDRDRDNTLLFFDAVNNTVPGLKFYGSLIIDDIDFSKITSDWYGNKLLYNIGVYSANLYNLFPVSFELQYVKISPYVFSHYIPYNAYTDLNTSLSLAQQPNSERIFFLIDYRPSYRLNIKFNYTFTRHGANETDEYGALTRNTGGDVIQGFREGLDSENVKFLDGVKEYSNSYTLRILYEPYKNYFMSCDMTYTNNSSQKSSDKRELRSSFGFSVIL